MTTVTCVLVKLASVNSTYAASVLAVFVRKSSFQCSLPPKFRFNYSVTACQSAALSFRVMVVCVILSGFELHLLVLICVSMCCLFGSKYFFTAGSQTSSKPLIVAAGFDGTGLSALERALALLGKTNTAFPAFGTDGDCDPARPGDKSGRQCAHRSLIDAVTQSGFQSSEFPPSIWSETDAVLGHPVPMFVWDFLEAFPNAKVILTVRQADELWDALRQLASYSWSSKLSDRNYRFPLKMLLFGMQRNLRIDQRHFLRNYLQHNAKVTRRAPSRNSHRVPRARARCRGSPPPQRGNRVATVAHRICVAAG